MLINDCLCAQRETKSLKSMANLHVVSVFVHFVCVFGSQPLIDLLISLSSQQE